MRLQHAIARRGREHLQALLLGPPLQNIDVHRADAPFSHRQPVGLVKVDRVRADQRRAVIVDLENLVRFDDAKFRAQAENATNRRPHSCTLLPDSC